MADFIGTILELNENQAIVMTDTCDFVKVKRQPKMFLGQQIRFKKSDININAGRYMKYIALIASVFIICFSYTLMNQFFIPKNVYAYVDVDINPSIEFAIDKNIRVLDIKPLNTDARTLLKELNLAGLPVKQAIIKVVKESKRKGFIKLNKNNTVLVSASISINKNQKPDSSDQKVLDDILADIGKTTFKLGNEKIKPDIFIITPESRNLAVKNKISMGRYALYNKIKDKKITISINEAKTAHVSDMLDEARINGNKDLTPKTDGDKNHNNSNNFSNQKDNTNKSGKDNQYSDNVIEDKKNIGHSNNEKSNDIDTDKSDMRTNENNGNNDQRNNIDESNDDFTTDDNSQGDVTDLTDESDEYSGHGSATDLIDESDDYSDNTEDDEINIDEND